MLLGFSAKNFKSFKNGFDLSMKASLVRDLNYSVKVADSDRRVLPTSVIYGPNAAGKSSFIESMMYFKSIILDGDIIQKNDSIYNDRIKELIPFAYSEKIEPLEFRINFINENIEFEYLIKFNLGCFNQYDYNPKIIYEALKIEDKSIFTRSEDKIEVNYENIDKDFLIKGLDINHLDNYINIFNENIDKTSLFLCTHFATMISKDLFDIFFNWIQNRFVIIPNFNKLSFGMKSSNSNIVQLPPFFNNAIQEIGSFGTNLEYIRDKNGNNVLYSDFASPTKVHKVPSMFVESLGTIKFLDILPLLLTTIKNGSVLVVDELDASLHPMVVMSIANIFHDPDINIHHAQLIFNTHNPVFLNNKVFRRDEMCFVEKDKDTNISDFYKLSDFLTNSSTPTRNTTDYLNNYFMNRYGAIEYVDLSDAFIDFMKAFDKDFNEIHSKEGEEDGKKISE